MFKKPNSGKKGNLSQFGLLDIPDLDDGDEPLELSDDDFDLEAELAAISGGSKRNRPRKPAPVASANLDAMIAASLKDVPSDEEVSGDDDDPDLLSELKELAIDDDEAPPPPARASRPAPPPPSARVSAESSTVSLLQDRISNYTIAEKTAKESGESGRARRFGRGLKTLNDLLKQARAGRPVNDEDIPPPVAVGKTGPARPEPAAVPEPAPEPTGEPEPALIDLGHEEPSLPEPMEPPPPPPSVEVSDERQQGLQMILRRKEEFKAAALACKHSGDKAMALEYLKVVKQFEIVVDAYRSGQEMDLNELPTVENIAAALRTQKVEDQTQQSTAEPTPAPVDEATGLVTGSTMDEALKLRLAAFEQQEAKAKEEGNSSKARRMGRIVKQYKDAIRQNSAGKPVAADELPTPAGHGPLPTAGQAAPAPSQPPSTSSGSPAPAPAPAPSPSPAASPSPSPAARARPAAGRHDKQLAFLLLRQTQFKEAALKAKKNGDIGQAKEYLRAAKGFDAVIEAAKGGLVVDLKSLPLPPKAKSNLEHTFDIVSAEDCATPEDPTPIDADGSDVLSRLHNQLLRQLQLCRDNRDHNRAMANIAEANRFEHLAVAVKQDLDVVAVAKSLGQSPPKFHYETRQFSVVQCNTDLNENDLELTIVRGIAYNVPNPREVDTYVKFEFPYPQETPVSDRTYVIKNTNSPEYKAVFPLAIQRGARACLRVFKRHAIKLEVYSEGGWFRRDALLGTVAVKLAPLETQVTLNEAFPLMDGRRPAGGSLEVKLRVRTPLLQQQVENTKHRWLVIDS